MRTVLTILLTLMLAPAAWADLQSHDIVVGGLPRHYLLYVPTSLSAYPGPHPLVVVLHGGGGTAAEVRRSTSDRFDALAEANGFVVLYPDAIDRMWDTGEGEVSAALRHPRDDLGFLQAAIAETESHLLVDHSRVFATGISRGGHASYLLACRAPGLIRAIAPVAMTLPVGLSDDCATGAPLGVLLIQGTADPLVPYSGGRVTVMGRGRDTVLSADATLALFAARNRCTADSANVPIGAVDRLTWQGCAAPTRLDRVNGGGHTWPSGRHALPGWLVGPTNTDISAPDEIWAFFSGFPGRP